MTEKYHQLQDQLHV